MSRHLEKAGSLLNIICRSNYADCVNFLENLDAKGIELISKLIYVIVSGKLSLDPHSHKRLKEKIKKDISNIKKLFCYLEIRKTYVKKEKFWSKKNWYFNSCC